MKLAGDTAFHPRAYPVAAAAKSSGARLRIEERADPWDVANQQRMLQLESAGAPDLYEKLQEMRETERAEMEKRQRVDNPNVRRSLDDAIEFVGSCQQMCPVYERVRRVRQNAVKEYELRGGKISPDLAVKSFSRPAAGQPPALPSDVRPPSVLKRTTEYLVSQIVPLLPASHPFLWDRTRSVRQDFTYQNYAGPEALECIQEIVRIHLVCLNVMVGEPDWSKQQELEQFNKALQTLDEFYALRTRRTLEQCPSEPEMRAYQLLSGLYDPGVAAKVEGLPAFVRESAIVQLAFELRALRGVPGQLFRRLAAADVPPLVKVLCRVHFPRLRLDVLAHLRRCLNRKSRVYPADRFSQLMGFEPGEFEQFCEQNKLDVSEGWVDVSGDTNASVEASRADLDLSGVLGGAASVPMALPAALPAALPRVELPHLPVQAPPAFKQASNQNQLAQTENARQLSQQLLREISSQHCTRAAEMAKAQQAKEQEAQKAQQAQAAAAQAAAAQAAAAQAQAQAKAQAKQALFISLAESILKHISSERSQVAAQAATQGALRANELRKRNLRRVLVGVARHGRHAVQRQQQTMWASRCVQEYEQLLRDEHSPRLAPRYVVSEAASSPARAPAPARTPAFAPAPAPASTLSIPHHRRILLLADWQSPQGELLKTLFGLDDQYRAHTNGSVIGPAVDDPDIVVNTLSPKYAHYLDGPCAQLPSQVSAVLEAHAAAPMGALTDAGANSTAMSTTSADSTAISANVTLFAPKRRLLSTVSPPPKRAQTRQASLHRLQQLIRGTPN